jgi:DNA-binding beta-propeller fold protein YncE
VPWSGGCKASNTALIKRGAIASDGTHVWVANDSETNDGSVTELNAATGALVKVLSKSKDEFGFPDAIASDGTHVWVANGVGDSLTEFSA